MLQEIRDYTRCAIENKFTISSYAVLSSSAFLYCIYSRVHSSAYLVSAAVMSCFGFLGLVSTKFGMQTYDTYRRLRKLIKEKETINQRLKDIVNINYCNRTAMKMAAKEAGLEHLL